MRSKNPELMQKIYSFIDTYYCDKHISPSVNIIAEGVGTSKATAQRYLVEMDNNGMIHYDGASRTIVTNMIRKFIPDSTACPVVGAIPCGPAEEQEENVLEYISLPVSLFGKGSFYILKAFGDSMVDAGIEDGDKVVIRTDCEAKVGDIVVALTGENESTLKVYGGIDPDSEEAVLLYRNQKVYPDKQIRVKRLVVQGVARHVIKAL